MACILQLNHDFIKSGTEDMLQGLDVRFLNTPESGSLIDYILLDDEHAFELKRRIANHFPKSEVFTLLHPPQTAEEIWNKIWSQRN